MGKRPDRKRVRPLPPEFMLSREYLKPLKYGQEGPVPKEQASDAVPQTPDPL